MIKGEKVTLIAKSQTGVDDFNAPVYSETSTVIKDVLIAPTTADEQKESLELYNRRVVYTLAIPKTDSHVWEGQKVSFWGETYDVVGIPTRGIDHLIPLKWNLKVRVARHE